MIIIHSMNDLILPRTVSPRLDAVMRIMPAVVVCGARQTGKTTIARAFGLGETEDGRTSHPATAIRRFASLDDMDVLDLARRDPDALVRGTRPVTLDEVQRAPELLGAVKREIDRKRVPGRFLLTGSANLLLMRRVSESLAGRATYLTLWPMTRREHLGLGRCGIWEKLLEVPDRDWLDVVAAHAGEPEDWRTWARRGGFPFPAVHLRTPEEKAVWFAGYVQTYLERDLQVLSSIAALPDFRRLMRAACLRLGSLVNQSDLGRDIGLPQPTVHRYLNLLETSYVLVRVPAYTVNRTKRLIKSPRLYWSDTGLAMHLSQEEEPRGAHLENLVLQDLLVWRDSRSEQAEILHWRTTTNDEVDFVIEAGGALVPVEVKATGRPRLRDASHLRTFRKEYGRATRPGLLLHGGNSLEWITPEVLAAPWWMVI